MDLGRILKTSAVVGLASAVVGCSNVRGYVLGSPLTEEAKQAEDIRLRREASRTIVPASDVGPGYFRVETKNSSYSLDNRTSESRYVEPKDPAGLIIFKVPFGK